MEVTQNKYNYDWKTLVSTNYRYFVLAFISATIFIIYRFLTTFSLTLRFCWDPSELWFSQGIWSSPYIVFSFIFFVLFCWVGIELLILFKNSRLLRIKTLYIIFITIFLTAQTVGHYRYFQTLQAVSGELRFFDIWPDSKVLWRHSMPFPNGYTSWWDFLFQESCKIGLDPHDMSRADRDVLYQKYLEKEKVWFGQP